MSNKKVKSSAKEPETTQVIKSKDSQNWPFDNGGFASFDSLRREVDGIFNQFTNRFSTLSQNASDEIQMPALDVNETDKAFEISAEMPGVAEEDVDVSVTDSLLTIHGKKQQSSKSEDADIRISECSYGVYERSLTLPFNCDAKSIKAKYDNGFLHLTVPKPKVEASKTQKVTIKSAA